MIPVVQKQRNFRHPSLNRTNDGHFIILFDFPENIRKFV